jgi:hypothetical protein
MLADRFRHENFSLVVFDDPSFFFQLVDLSSHGFPGDTRCLTDGKSVRGLEVLYPLRSGRRFLIEFDAAPLEGIKPMYVMMCDLTEYNGQYEVPLKLPVEKIEIAEEKVVHDDRNRRFVRIVLIRIERKAGFFHLGPFFEFWDGLRGSSAIWVSPSCRAFRWDIQIGNHYYLDIVFGKRFSAHFGHI